MFWTKKILLQFMPIKILSQYSEIFNFNGRCILLPGSFSSKKGNNDLIQNIYKSVICYNEMERRKDRHVSRIDIDVTKI